MTASFRIASFLAALVALVGCHRPAEAPPPAPPEVGIVDAQPTSVPLTRDLVGRLAPYRSADVRARIAGILLERVYTEGSDVKEGDVLFRIDPAPLEAALAQANASLAQARATATNAKATVKRVRELVGRNYVSRSDVDNAEAADRSAAAQVQQAEAAVQAARINLGYATVRAPISGRAGQQQVTEGALVGQGSATLLTTIDQLDPIYANFTLAVGELDQLRRAAEAGSITLLERNRIEVQLHREDGTPLGQKGLLDFSDVSVDPATGSVALRAQIPNPDRALLPGMYVSGLLGLGQLNAAYRVPQSALQRDTRGAYVLVVGQDDKVERRDVVADRLLGDAWIVTSGLGAGDRMIAAGVQKARVGQAAKAVPYAPPPVPTAPVAK